MQLLQSKTARLALILSIVAEAVMAACIYGAGSDSQFGPFGCVGQRFVQFHLLGASLGAMCAPGFDLNNPPFDQTAIWVVVTVLTALLQTWILFVAGIVLVHRFFKARRHAIPAT